LWLNATSAPPRSPRAGNSTRVLHEVYLHRTDTKEDLVSQQIEDALDADASSPSSQCVKASGFCAPSAPPGTPVRYLYMNRPRAPPMAHGRRARQIRNTACRH